ncbi:CAF17-like 4Fe-4S cluster assembly/insertion protein YgfZ [Oceanicella actignis]|uniref:CAF17 C-terminal domain-containing protein n=1 Tax=Oceanicella actignis TaxID=1189325 RepID=A0A1M7T8K1_9RHOB|nr:folate-binding protein YgfZ [Oceanicella actignis]SET49661.1 hypothetical protein SAMN04488119_10558 [Oceanicella actignis]SHN67031.1 hypothetical protein SAMN05216200_10557 [Oceanicella actignis]
MNETVEERAPAAPAGLRGRVAPERAVLRIDGDDPRGFLQGLATNDMRRLERGPVYAALLTPQGKYLFDFIVTPAPEGDGVLLDLAADRAPALAARLGMYRLRRKLTIAPADLQVVQLWGEGWERAPGVLPDPRHPGLGGRVLTAEPEAALAGAAQADAQERLALRVALGVPASGVDLIPEETYILEAGFERLNGVDFRKGCYVGQEIVARMKHKTQLRKGLARVALEGAAAPGAELTTEDGRAAGRLGSVAGKVALAHLRFDRAEDPLRAGAARARLLERLVPGE